MDHHGSSSKRMEHLRSAFEKADFEMAMMTSHQRSILKIRKNQERFLFITETVNFCPNIIIIFCDPVPLKCSKM
jgi:hypothetical protein